MMKLRNILINLVILFMLIGISSAFAGPEFYAQDPVHDFGEINQGTANKHIFKFENRGDADLEIINIKPSCGCTAALLSSQTIPPGGTGELEVTFNSGKFKGKVLKTVSLETNEEPLVKMVQPPGLGPRASKAVTEPTRVRKLSIKAFVKYDPAKDTALKRAREAAMKKSKAKRRQGAQKPGIEVDFQPKSIALGTIQVGKEYKRTIKVINNTAKEFKINNVSVAAPYASAMIKKVSVLQNSPGEVVITVMAAEPGSNTGKITIRLAGWATPIVIPISWNAK